MHSVAQYLSGEELDAILARFRRLLRPDGLLLIGDVIAPGRSNLADASALLGFAARNGSLRRGADRARAHDASALSAAAHDAFGFARYDEAAITAKLATAGSVATRAAPRISATTTAA